ncbi:hypothetical protein H0H87_006949 [Tephrocybe sp. NHM501043]|nr:hypothetical protein H0H87_006949 [Tephrocybe sp. NHM501043]
MPRENSLSDSEGRSLTPDMDDFNEGPISPMSSNAHAPTYPIVTVQPTTPKLSTNLNPVSPSRRSILSKVKSRSPNTIKSHNWPNSARVQIAPIDRFRGAVRKVMALHRGTSYLSVGRIGAEPGVNPRRASASLLYGHIHQDCVIEVIDYSSVRSSAGRMTNAEFINLLDDPAASERESWVKVRWINIGGLSWDVIKAVSIKYDLHPLALEDVFHTRSQNRSKADYYNRHLFLRVLCHQLGSDDEPAPTQSAAYGSTLTDGPRSMSPAEMEEDLGDIEENGLKGEDEETMYDSTTMSRGNTLKKRRGILPFFRSAEHDVESSPADRQGSQSSLRKLVNGAAAKHHKQAKNNITLDALKQGERVKVNVSPMFIFLLRDGTVISIHTTPNIDLTTPISKRLHQRDTGLRTSADPSLLVHALLDLIVDNALEVIDEYHTKINKFERTILLKPNVKTVRYRTPHSSSAFEE